MKLSAVRFKDGKDDASPVRTTYRKSASLWDTEYVVGKDISNGRAKNGGVGKARVDDYDAESRVEE